MRSGDLTRSTIKFRPRESKAFQDIGPETWLEGVVQRITMSGVSVILVHPTSGVQAYASLSKDDFTESFFNECIRGGKVRVRIRGQLEEGKILDITMKDP